MGRPRVANAKTVTVAVKFSEEDVRALDAARHGIARSTYIRTLVRTALTGTPVAVDPISAPEVHQQPPIPDPPHPHPASLDQTKRHFHRYKKAGEPVRYIQGVAQYRQRCECGDTKEGP